MVSTSPWPGDNVRRVDAGPIAQKHYTPRLYCLACGRECSDSAVEFTGSADAVLSRACPDCAEKLYLELAERWPERFPGNAPEARPWWWSENAPREALERMRAMTRFGWPGA